MSIETNIKHIQSQIRDWEKKYNRIPNSVSLLAASKGQSVEKISLAHKAGQLIYGENYLQEALTKIKMFTHENFEWHFIGPIQRNKTRKIAENFSWVESVNSTLIADRLNEQRPRDYSPINICIEVNINNEMTKSGIAINQLESLANHCVKLPNLKLRGLMAIPAHEKNFEKQRLAFRRLSIEYNKLIKNGFSLDTLSMGMSDDMEAAIAEGATLVRIGTNIFGQRIQSSLP